MDFQQFREITLSVTHSQLPNSRQLEFGQSLAGALEGTLTIRGITRHVAVPIKIKRMASGVLIKGDTHISWTDYGIADPSTLIATVKDRVEIRYEVRLNR
jgi:polyisoprenoid-binding protein YceI